MASIVTINATIQTYDGHAINDGVNYLSYIDAGNSNSPEGRPILADVDFDWPYFVGSERTSRSFQLHIFILQQDDYEERKAELKKWFNTQSGDIQYLVATFTEDVPERRIGCRPVKVSFEAGLRCVVTLEAYEPWWESNDVETVTWAIMASNDQQVVTNAGNFRCWPVLKVKGTAIPANTWRFQRPVLIRNNILSALNNYPLELTGGGWDTAALVANAAKTTQIDDGDGITAGDTIITVDDTSAFYEKGLLYIGTEQIYYGAKTATTFTYCVRGVGGTTAATHANNDTVYQSECFADGRDIRVELDGIELPRWFGAAARVSKGPNYNNTLLWAVISSLPAQNAYDSAGELITLGTDLAQGKTVVASSAAAGAPGSNVTDAKTATYWHAEIGATSGNLVIDLGESKTINRVRLWHPNSDDAAKDFTIQTSPNNVDWTTRVTVTNNAALGKYSNHDFADVACRYVKIDVTAVQSGGEGLRIGSVNVFCATHRLRIKYGNCNATNYVANDTQKPMFRLDTSTNGSWDYDDFYDASNSSRTAAWKPIDYQGLGLQRHYPTTQDGVYASVADALGVANHTSTTMQIRDGYQLDQPCGISEVTHQGYTKQNPDYRRWRLLSVPGGGDVVAEYENTDITLSVWTAYGPVVTTLSQTAIAIIFYHWIKVSSDTAMYAEATDVTVTIVNEPTVTLGSADYFPNTQTLDCKISNNTTGQAIYVMGEIKNSENIVIDCSDWTVEEEDSGRSRLEMVTWEPNTVRERWLELEAGSNTLEYVDTGVVGVTITVEWRSRWL